MGNLEKRLVLLWAAIVIGLTPSSRQTRITVQTAPLPRQEGERTSYAGAISNLAPCVVSVLSTIDLRKKSPAAMRRNPMLRQYLSQKGHAAPGTVQELEGLGSGVLVSSDGYIVTNNHVIDEADKITVATIGGQTFTAKVVGADPATDIAVLKISARDLPAAVLGDSSQLRVGDIVLAVGNPFGVGQTVTSGIVSATERDGFGITDYEDFIQTDAAINPGNSGGALADARGRVIGINTVILSSSGGFEGIGLAVPINLARNAMEQIISRGKVVRGYLGVSLRPISSDLAQAFRLPAAKGAVVADIASKSPAAQAGIKAGDIVLETDGQAVQSSRDLRLRIAQTKPGARMNLKLLRIGGQKAVTVTLGETPHEPPKTSQGNPK
jgi:Do/DeqQ family serine protease